MTKVVVPVAFTGAVEVEVPTRVPAKRRCALARKVALARLLATTDNPDAPEEDACDEYRNEFKLGEATAGRDWDGCKTTGASGRWTLHEGLTDDEIAVIVERLVEKADSAGLKPEDLDELVHELASSIAADINNGGLEDQVRYLVEGLGAEHAERQIAELIEGQPREGE
jgi:hypothetical protein